MPGTTPVYGLPYPEPSDLVANYPALGEDLAETLDEKLPSYQATAPASPSVGQVWIDSDDNQGRVWTGSVWQLFSGASVLFAADVSATTGSPAIATAGGFTTYKWTGNGSITFTKAGFADVLVVSGGMGQISGFAAGGGGSVILASWQATAATHNVVVGSGSAASSSLPGNTSGFSSIGTTLISGRAPWGSGANGSTTAGAGSGITTDISGTSLEYGVYGQSPLIANSGSGSAFGSGLAGANGVVIIRVKA